MHRRALRARLLSFRYIDGTCLRMSFAPRQLAVKETKSWPGETRPTLPDQWSLDTSVDVGPGPVSFEDHFAAFAAEDDLEVTPPDCRSVAAAHRTRCSLVLDRTRQGLYLDLIPPYFRPYMLQPLLFISPKGGGYL